MNSEQKEQNIQVPELPDNSNQNIMLVKSWQIKSWQIILFGIIIQWLIIIIGDIYREIPFVSNMFYLIFTGERNPADGALAGSIILIFSVALSIVGFILLSFLYFDRSRKFGAVLCILFGLISAVLSILFGKTLIGSSFLFAGIYYFWKKV